MQGCKVCCCQRILMREIDPTRYLTKVNQAKAQYQSAEANFIKANRDWQRVEKLYKQGVYTIDQYDTSRSNYLSAQANLANAKAMLDDVSIDLGYTDVVAGISGKTGMRSYDVGNLVGSSGQDVLTTITQLSPIYAEFSIPNTDYYFMTLKAMGEIQGPVVAIVLVLCSVFIPVAFIGGFSGAIYKQFAITIVISVVISGFVALSLTPALCVSILKAKEPKPFYLVRRFNDFFDWLTHKFGEQIGKALRRGILLVALFVAILITTWGLFSKLPTGLVPSEDKGSMISFIQLPPAASLSRTITEGKKGLAILRQEESVDSGFLIAGFDMLASAARSSGAVIFVTLKDWSERKESAFAIALKMMGAINANLDAFSLVTTPPAIMGLSTVGGFELYIQDRSGGSIKDLEKYANLLVAEANKREELVGVRSLFSANIPQYHLNLDRERAKAMNVNVDDVFTTMQSTFCPTLFTHGFP